MQHVQPPAGATPSFRALPHLDGLRGSIVRTLYWTIAALTLVVVAGSVWFNGLDMFRNVPATMEFGFRTFTDAGHPNVRNIWSHAARTAGLRDGDQIVAIDGAALPHAATEFDIGSRLKAAGGASVALSVVHMNGSLATLRLPRVPNVWAQVDTQSGLPVGAYSLLMFVTTEGIPVFLFTAALMLARRRPRDSEAMLFALAFLLLCWEQSVAFWLRSVIVLPDVVFQIVSNLAWISAFVAIAGFPDGRFPSRLGRWTVRTATATLAAIIVANLIFRGFAIPVPRYLNSVVTAVFLAAGAGAVVTVILRYLATPPGLEKQQIKWAMMGSCITLLLALITIPIEASGWVNAAEGHPLPFVFNALIKLVLFAALPSGLLVSLLRYRLYDADTRSAGRPRSHC